jgi:hypothetical protein
MCYRVTLRQKIKKNCQKVGQIEKKVVKKLSKSCQKVVQKVVKIVAMFWKPLPDEGWR